MYSEGEIHRTSEDDPHFFVNTVVPLPRFTLSLMELAKVKVEPGNDGYVGTVSVE